MELVVHPSSHLTKDPLALDDNYNPFCRQERVQQPFLITKVMGAWYTNETIHT